MKKYSGKNAIACQTIDFKLPTAPTNVDTELYIIKKFLDMPCGDQLYRKEIALLFKIVELKSKPIFFTNPS